MAHDVRPRVLRRRDDAPVDAALRPGSTGHHLSRLAAPVGRHDRGRHPDQQNGARATPGLRSDARSALGHLDGQLCQWWGVLPLFLLGGPGL